MAFEIKEFHGELNRNNFSHLSHFDVIITLPPNLFAISSTDTARSLNFRVNSVSFPGRTVRSTEYTLYGPEQKIGMYANYGDVNMSIICSADHREREFFMKWQDLVVGGHRVNSSSYDIGYYNGYVAPIEINTYRSDGKKMKTTKLSDAYPSGIGNIEYSWTNNDHAMLPITWSYHTILEPDAPAIYT